MFRFMAAPRVYLLTLGVLLFLIAPTFSQAPPEPSTAEKTKHAPLDEKTVLTRIAFGSCARQDKPQPIWKSIVAQKPQLFLFLGDNIYGDSDDIKVLEKKYQQLGAVKGYQQLQATCPIWATWDDHDYGKNDAGEEYKIKRASQKLFLKFFHEPKDSPRHKREGVYDAKVFGPKGKRVQVILLDTRYFRTALKRVYKPGEKGEGRQGYYGPNPDRNASILGPAQWKWLKTELQEPAELRLICSSIQILAQDHGYEKWANFPHEQRRLFDLIKETKAHGVIFLSGDRHLAEFSKRDDVVGYPLWEVTSSSLNAPSFSFTRGGVRWQNEKNRYREGMVFFHENFGMVLIDWKDAGPVVRLQVREESGDVVLQERVDLNQLTPNTK